MTLIFFYRFEICEQITGNDSEPTLESGIEKNVNFLNSFAVSLFK